MEQPKSTAERQSLFRYRQNVRGMSRLSLWVTSDSKDVLKSISQRHGIPQWRAIEYLINKAGE
jgi:hypothetical protein